MSKGMNIGGGWLKSNDRGDSISISLGEGVTIQFTDSNGNLVTLDKKNAWLNFYPNERKTKPTQPDYNLVASPKEERAAQRPPPAQKTTSFPRPRNFAPQEAQGETQGHRPRQGQPPQPKQPYVDPRRQESPPEDLWDRSEDSEIPF